MITTKTIRLEAGDPAYGPNQVVTTEPRRGEIANKDAPVEMYVNPQIAPDEYTPVETAAAQRLMNNNPAMVSHFARPLTLLKAQQIIRRCHLLLIAAARAAEIELCEIRPILVIAGDAREAAQHDEDTILNGNPDWVQLHRRASFDGGYWRDSHPNCKVRRPSEATQCDEYPYASSYEGFHGTTWPRLPSLRSISARDNNREGQALIRFYSNRPIPQSTDLTPAGHRPLLFPGCGWNLTQNPAPPNATTAQAPALEDSDYLLIPMPDVDYDSIAFCGTP